MSEGLVWPIKEPKAPAVRASAEKIIEDAPLTPAAKELIRSVVKSTRLWPSEKSAVAAELVEHFLDGIEEGRTVEDLIETFGDTKLAAKLIRRGKKRNRPLWWRFSRRFIQGVTLFVVLYVSASLLLLMRQPRVSVDYVAELSARIPAAEASEKAWPIYRAALLADPGMEDLYAAKKDENDLAVEPIVVELRPGDARWPDAMAALEKHRGLIEAARKGGLRPAMGFGWLEPTKLSPEDRKVLHRAMPVAAELPETLVAGDLTMAVYGRLAEMQNLLALDSWQAAGENDGARVTENYAAMVGFAKQLRELPLLWNQLLAYHLLDRANQNLGSIEHAYPRLLDGKRVELLHRMAAARPLFEMELSGQRAATLDLVQRTYSDGGDGDGMLTYEGIRILVNDVHGARVGPRRELNIEEKGLYTASLPVAAVGAASRKQIVAEMDRYLGAAAREAGRPMWQRRKPSASPMNGGGRCSGFGASRC